MDRTMMALVMAAIALGVLHYVPTGEAALNLGEAAENKYACSKPDDDAGFGGTHVTCKYSCSSKSELNVAVESTDADAAVYGETDCGGAEASCLVSGPICTGASEGLTTRNENNVNCDGSSDEFNSSPLRVACSSIGLGYICQLIKRSCDASARSSVTTLCLEQNPWVTLVESFDLDALLALVPDSPMIASFVAFEASPTFGIVAFVFEAETATCTASAYP